MKLTGEVGSIVNVRLAFSDPDNGNAPYDPGNVTIAVRTPGLVTTTYVSGTDPELEQESAGHYLFRLPLVEEGTYRWTWTGSSPQKAVVKSGACDAVDEGIG